jgi:hypothetical protein
MAPILFLMPTGDQLIEKQFKIFAAGKISPKFFKFNHSSNPEFHQLNG